MTLLQSIPTPVVVIIIFILIILFYLAGHHIRLKVIARNPDHAKIDLGRINGTLLGLLGLLLAFTFGMSNSRYNTRRELRIEEANHIGTATLRTDIYPDSVRKLLRANLKEYLEARIDFLQAGMDVDKMTSSYRKAETLSKKVWDIAASYAKVDDITTRTSQLIPALNNMIDITTTSRAAGEGTIPDSIMYFLFILCVCAAFLLGYDHKDKVDWIIVIGFAIMLSATVFNIIDLDRPRSGLVTMDNANQKIVELREMFEGE
ncbi:MAG TPA: hypothetical protein VK666_12940 [Chryseolinea sp.]|nr:hypothetical protein [Chryseolinea sp.]